MQMKSQLKQIIKAAVPNFIIQKLSEHRQKKHEKKRAEQFSNMSTQEVFKKIYHEGHWGSSNSKNQKFFSGTGSHDENVVKPYLKAVSEFLSSLEKKPNVVDLGCGDFSVGSKIRDFCGNYTACDIVPTLIEYNKEKYSSLGVDFRVINMTEDELPPGDVVCIRQALQHISNSEIQEILPKLSKKYQYLILTEHLPNLESFIPNIDIASGPDTRFNYDSGVVLSEAPFNFIYKNKFQICQVPEAGGILMTEVFEL